MASTNFEAEQTALYREGLGATLLGKIGADSLRKQVKPILHKKTWDNNTYWPIGDKIYNKPIEGINLEKLKITLEEAFEISDRRAIVIVYDGKLVYEKFALNYTKESKFLGWSMTKSLENTMLGILEKEGKISLSETDLFNAWKNDNRKNISVEMLARMTSGLEWDEDYTKASDVTKMLYTEDDMANYASSKKLKSSPNTVYNYSTGSAMLLSKVIKNKFSSKKDYLEFLQNTLCRNLNIEVSLETDGAGSLVFGSYAWASVRDWAKLGFLYYNDGLFNGQQIITKDWVDRTKTETLTNTDYGILLDINKNQSIYTSAPKDLFYFSGYSGQKVFIIPSKKLIISHLAFTSDTEEDFNRFLGLILQCVKS